MGERARRLSRTVAVAAAVATLAGLAAVVPPVPASARPAARTAPAAGDTPEAGSIPTLPRSSALVTQLYRSLLGRLPSRDETAFWGGRIDAGSARSAVGPILDSDEALGHLVDAAYQDLGRPADPDGAAFWLGQLHSGLSAEGLQVYFLSSNEFYANAGSTADGWLGALYQHLLGRPIDADGQAYWGGRLAGGAPRWAVVFWLIHTAEVADKTVAQVYRQVFDRPVDAGAATYWRGQFIAARIGRLSLTSALATSTEATTFGCDPLMGKSCLLPFPNDYFSVPDSQSLTGERIALRQSMLPSNDKGVRPDPSATNRSDGFSPGQAALVSVPSIDLAKTGAAPITDIAQSLDANAPVAVVDATTGERMPIWTELDSNPPPSGWPDNRLLYIRPARNYTAGHRYIVVLRNLKDSNGATIPASDVFTRYRDAQPEPGNVDGFESRRPHLEQLFNELGTAGIARADLFLAWDFTVASTMNTTGRMLHIRDDAFARLGTAAPAFHVTQVDQAPAAGIARRIMGTYSVPSYLTQDGPGGQFNEGPDGLPAYAGHDLTTTFTCLVPTTVLTTPGRATVYGHGLFGGQGEVNSSPQVSMAANHDMVYCATDWLGMAEPDLTTAFDILKDVSGFPKLADRTQEGVLATLFLARLMRLPSGLSSDPAFQSGGHPVIDTADVFYDGNSQGGILGGITTAVSTEWTRAVLGVPGMDFSELVERSVDFDPFNQVLSSTYTDPIDRTIGLQVLQMQWDRSEPDGYAAHLTSDPLPGTPAHQVLMHVALGDHQVATVAAENEARTAGIPAHLPAVASGRSADVNPLWGIAGIPSYPSSGSGLVYWDSGSPVPPTTNTPPRAGHDPHEDPRRSPLAQQQKSDFLVTNGVINDPCNGQPCTAPQT